MATIRVHTAQNVTLEYEVASLGDRITAAIIDNVILVAWIAACFLVFSSLMDLGRNSNGSIVGVILVGLLVGIPYVFYNLICEVYFNGQSLGKKARNIRVMRLDGTAPRLGDYLLRWLLRIIDVGLFSGMVAVITIAANGKGQRLGDLAAGTTVIKIRPVAPHAVPTAADLTAVAGYQPVFPQAALLADHDVTLIRQLLQRAASHNDYLLLNEIANKVKTITGIQTSLQDEPFLKTILRDHAHLAQA
ncbi:RDD family protein [Hymenobacter negativus]|uniref:RDD family protein n=1 Tax=Hymenobacter negativus TaxID=2795026 RepID=A0ABS3QNG0_9BACT|nr:RDD family protein [Hymenobacter negativus]MBO2012737.1 RDD family protein [Hymenobacter negativus]